MPSKILIQQTVLDRLMEAHARDRLGHAYLFYGPAQCAKSETALAVAKFLNCEAPTAAGACHRCPACLKIERLAHPDVFLVAGQEGSLKIEQARQLMAALQLKPYEGRWKVFIIKAAEALTQEAANALLKTLEEPPAQSLIILTTAFLDQIPDTVRSRCRLMPFAIWPDAELARELKLQEGLSDQEAYFLACFSQGSLGKAAQYRQEKLFERKEEILKEWLSTSENDSYFQRLLTDKEALRQQLTLVFSWYRDLMLLKSAAGTERCLHQDALPELQRLKERYDASRLSEILESLARTIALLDDNFNMKIAVSVLRENL